MKAETLAWLDTEFAAYPSLRAEAVPLDELHMVMAHMQRIFPVAVQTFILRYGGAIVGPFPIFGLRPVEAMGRHLWHIAEVNHHFHEQQWLGIGQWLIISHDHAGNPFGIDTDGRVYLSDHDRGSIEPIAEDFEGFLNYCRSFSQ